MERIDPGDHLDHLDHLDRLGKVIKMVKAFKMIIELCANQFAKVIKFDKGQKWIKM
jgi:hypothetical protein